MKFGLHSVNLHSCGHPDAMARFGRAAEAAGEPIEPEDPVKSAGRDLQLRPEIVQVPAQPALVTAHQ